VAIGVGPKASGCSRNLRGSFRVDTGTKNGKARRENHGGRFLRGAIALGNAQEASWPTDHFTLSYKMFRILVPSVVRYVDYILF
jgi:hypothetical protein